MSSIMTRVPVDLKTCRKIIFTGHVLEVYEYEKPPLMGTRKLNEDDEEFCIEKDELTEEEMCFSMMNEIFNEQKRYMSNIIRTRNMVRRLALANFDHTSKFVTFTFDDKKVPKEHSRMVKSSNAYWRNFMQRMRRAYGNFRYIAVIEFQKRGAVHYHCIWDLPYIPVRKLALLWGCGGITIEKIEHVDNVGSYLIKYMTKNFSDKRLSGCKAYNCSKGLVRPVVLRGDLAEEIYRMYDLEKMKEVFTNTYESEYQGQITYKEYNLLRSQ